MGGWPGATKLWKRAGVIMGDDVQRSFVLLRFGSEQFLKFVA